MKWTLACLTGIALAGVGVALAIAQTGSTKEDPAIRQALAAYVEAFNKGDVNAVLTFWAEDGEQIDTDGNVTKGKAQLKELMADTCKPNSGVQVKGTIRDVKMVSANVAIVDGTSEVTTPEGTEAAGFEGVMVFDAASKKWLISRVRDFPLPEDENLAPSYTQLKGLEWLVGEWTATEADSQLTLNARWMKKKAYLVIEQKVLVKNEEVYSLQMMVGYNVEKNTLYSWVFDCNGGRGEASWSREGNVWLVDADGVTSDGSISSSNNTWKFVDANTMEWKSTNRQVDEQPRPDIQLTYKKKTK